WTKPTWAPISEGGLMPSAPTGNMPYGPPALGMKHYRGLLGARTALTGGKGSVADYVAEGKKAGLHFIIFAEDFEQLTPENWTRFKKECADASGDDFLAVPGFEWRNPLGDRSIMVGPVVYPDNSVLAPGTKRIVHQAVFWFAAGCPMNLSCSSTNQTPLWNFTAVNAFPVEVWENGKRTEDNFKEYLYDQAREHLYRPVVVNRVYSPADLARAVQSAPATVLVGTDLREVLASNIQLNYWGAGQRNSYVSGGPYISAFQGYNLDRATAGTLVVPGTDRWRIRVATASDKGIREIQLYDGRELVYRYQAEGKREFTVEFDGHHERQHEWVPVVEDVEGKRAVGSVLMTRDLLCIQQMDSDRQNHDPFGIQLDKRGRPQIIFQYATHQFIKGQMQCFRPGNTSNTEEYHPPGLDCTEMAWAWGPVLDLKSEPAEPPMSGWCMRYFTTCSSVEAFIVDMWLDWKYPADAPLKKQFGPAAYDRSVPTDVATVSFRYIDAFHPYGRPAPVVCEIALKFLKDVVFSAGAPSPWFITAGCWGPWAGHYDHYTVAAGGRTIGGNLLVDETSMSMAMNTVPAALPALKPGDYVALYPSLWGSCTIMALSDNLAGYIMASKGGLMSLWGFQLSKREFKAGEELKGTMLFVKGSYPELPNNALAETIRTTMGISGKPSYSLDPRIGKVVSSLYRIRAEAQNGVWAAVIGKADLPLLLPIEVSGLNDRWEAFRYDRQTKIMRPVPVCEGVGYASVDIAGGADIVIGHPVTSKAPELRLNVFQTGDKWSVIVHNPTDKPIETTLTCSPEFPCVAGMTKTVSAPARSSLSIPVP
ncbi:MAG: hypothetical protein L6437_03005, partial [Kiritimatiellae bacterium]|nr:hypothetical protein [Kiritimatiellia bacterium]